MALPEVIVLTADEAQRYADELHKRAKRFESDGDDPEAKMLYAAAGAVQGIAYKLKRGYEQGR